MVHFSNDGSKSSGRAARRAEARKLDILRAAARVFRRQGLDASGMREIAAEADLSPGNLYHYFRGKDQILYFCQDRALDTLLRALAQARRSRKSRAVQLERAIHAHILCLLDEMEGSVAHLEVEALPAKLRRPIIEKRDRYEKGVQRLVAAGVRSGEFTPCDPKLVTRAILGAANWTARWFRSDGPQPPAVVAGALARYLVRGLRSENHHEPHE